MYRILAVDPGPSTGFAHRDRNGNISTWITRVSDSDSPHLLLWQTLEQFDELIDMLIVEKFEFRKTEQHRDKIDYRAAEHVGVCKLWAQQHHLVTPIYQSSSLATGGFWGDKHNNKIRQLGLWSSAAAPHGIDALRHLLYYATFQLHEQQYIDGLR